MHIRLWFVALTLGAGLAGCGETYLERGASGAAIGAAAGQVIADDPLAGAALGAGAGVLTTPR